MIDYQLKPCCNECNYLKLDYEQETIDWNMCKPAFLETRIFCKHQAVCGKYNEVKYHSEVEQMTKKQRELIECMNEFCNEKCDLSASKKEASEYIDRNIEEYKLEMEVMSPMFGY